MEYMNDRDMAHLSNPEREYRLLQERLDLDLNGAPASPAFTKILKLLFSPDEAAFARRLPAMPQSLSSLHNRFSLPQGELEKKLTELAHRGLVVDIEMAGERFFTLAPVVIGFFEFTYMRKGADLPWKELSALFDEYMAQDDRFMRGVFAGETQAERALVHEEALPRDLGEHIEICDWERASAIIKSKKIVAVSTCACRHKALHLDKACQNELDNCLSFDLAAKILLRNGLAKEISVDEGLDVLQRAKESGLCQNADNVKEDVNFICNCCRCCCGFVHAVRHFDLKGAIVSSNWLARVVEEKCVGCKKCELACPVEAIVVTDKKAQVSDHCIGCGVCFSPCKFEAIKMEPRRRRVFTPETMFDKLILQAIERGKLSDLLFSDMEKWSHRALGRIARLIEHSPPTKALLAVKPLRSIFLKSMVGLAKMGPKPTV